jgi:hypothetical protein
MKGYLQRMAFSSLKPGRPIRPVLGSVFSAPKCGFAIGTLGIVEEVSLVSRTNLLQKPGCDTPPVSSVPPAIRLVPVITGYQPPIAEGAKLMEVMGQAKHRGARREKEPVLPVRSYTPLVAGDFRPPDSTAFFPEQALPSVVFNQGTKRRNADLTKNSEPPFREPDEIQIHIGRIEVTAVQAASPRPAAAKPQRRVPSLDEYLRRRDGRTV